MKLLEKYPLSFRYFDFFLRIWEFRIFLSNVKQDFPLGFYNLSNIYAIYEYLVQKKGIKRKKEELLDSSYETYFYLILNPFHPDLLQPRTKEAIESRIESKEKM